MSIGRTVQNLEQNWYGRRCVDVPIDEEMGDVDVLVAASDNDNLRGE